MLENSESFHYHEINHLHRRIHCSLPDWINYKKQRSVVLWRWPLLRAHSCVSKRAWTDHQTASAPSCSGWAERKTAADASRADGKRRRFLLYARGGLRPAASRNTPSGSDETNGGDETRGGSQWLKETVTFRDEVKNPNKCGCSDECISVDRSSFIEQ